MIAINNTLALVLAAALACIASPASAQRMYRCNNSYQDQPCSGSQEGRVVSGGAPAQAALSPAAPIPSADCARRGEAAQKIKWARESGQTRQQQEASVGNGGYRDLVADVYSRQGTAPQVRSAIESDCMAEKERAAQAATLLEAANALKGSRPSTPLAQGETASGQGTAAAPVADTLQRNGTGSAGSAASKQFTCQRLADQLNTISTQQRAGGTASRMDGLRLQYQEVSGRQRSAGC
ncbi:MAG: hypothetical protein EOO28_07600 [Comamonadaceae bacterium]|nr:MAG: hypothetical protein EOO28_07600 [Comamonadaceae bacterium]